MMLLLLLLPIVATTATSIPSFPLTSLQASSRQLKNILTTTGLFSVSLDGFHGHDQSKLRQTVFSSMCQCMETSASASTRILTSTTATRTTLATATVGMKHPLPLEFPSMQESPQDCPIAAMEELRDVVAHLSNKVLQVIDGIMNNASNDQDRPLLQDLYGKRYDTLSSISHSSNQLEHFHVYEQPSGTTMSTKTTNDSESWTLDWHTDAGLFLAFVPAMDCDTLNTNNDASFWYRDENGIPQQVTSFDPNAIVFMMGSGMENWISSPTEMAIKATRHAIRMQPGQKRAWYGMMHLVPEQAIIEQESRKTFADMKESMALSSTKTSTSTAATNDNDVISIGCGVAENNGNWLSTSTSRPRRLGTASDASECNNSTNFFCWMTCMEIPEAENKDKYFEDGYSLYCLDPSILAHHHNDLMAATEPCQNGYIHDPSCVGKWKPTTEGVTPSLTKKTSHLMSDEDKYCYGGTSMYMDGFHWVHETTCIIYLFPSWVLSSRIKLFGASVGTFGLAVLLEYILLQRRLLSASIMSFSESPIIRLSVTTLIYGLQLSLGYILMLIIMTYSGVLFLCTMLGLMMGHALFNAKEAMWKNTGMLCGCQSRNKNAPEQAPVQMSIIPSSSPSHYNKGNTISTLSEPEGATPCCMNTFHDDATNSGELQA